MKTSNTTRKKNKLEKEANELWKQLALKKRGTKCLACGELGDVFHHFIPMSRSVLLRFSVENAIPICSKCHYKIKYSENAKVYVYFPNKLNDFLKQKRRTAGAHDNIRKHVSFKKIPRMKTFLNEILGGFSLFFNAKNIKQFFWILFLFPIRLYIWLNLFYNSKIKKRKYSDAWKRVKSTK